MVHPATSRNDGKPAAALDVVSQHDPQVLGEALSGQSELTKQAEVSAFRP
jgi:hypothetical protein